MPDINTDAVTEMTTPIRLIRSVEYLYTSPEGDIDFEKSKQVLADLALAKRLPADYDIILDFRRTQCKLSTTNIWFLAAELAKHDDTFRNKVAVLISPGSNPDNAEFFELCSKNRGFNVDVFTNHEDAIQWLYEDRTSIFESAGTHTAQASDPYEKAVLG